MSRVTKTTISIIIVTILSKILGFMREIVLANMYGTSMYSDVFVITYSIPVTLFASVAIAIGTIFIPLYCEEEKINGEDSSINFTNNILSIVTILSIVIAILGIIFARPLVKLLAMGFEGETLKVAIDFTRITIIGVVFIFLSNIIKSYLNIKNSFNIPVLVGIPFNIIIIITIILSTKISPYLLPIGALIAMASQLVFQIPFAYKKGYKYRPYLNINDKNIKKFKWLLMPVLIGVAVNQVNTIVDRSLASTLVEGSISALNYANRLNGFVMGIFIASIASVIYPILSNLSSDKNKDKFTEAVIKSVNSVVLLVIPISIGAIVLSNPIVKLLFQRGAFDERATSMTAIALAFYSIGMVAFGLRDILGKVFYSLQDTKTPMINGAIAMGLNIVLNLILVKFMGHAGLAFATSISSIICIFLLFRSLKKKIGYFGQDKILKTTIKSLVAAIVMGVVTYFVYNGLSSLLGTGFIVEAVSLFGSISIGAIVYCTLVTILKVEEINIIADMVKKKLKI